MIDATPLLQSYARRRLAALDRLEPGAAQERQLLRLLHAARRTRFGRAHEFDRIATADAFQKRVPLRHYEDFWKEFWAPSFPRLVDATWPGSMPFFALSSGTTSGASKHIPVSQEMVRANRRAALEVLCHHLRNRPDSRVLAGRNFVLGGTSALAEIAPGIKVGDLSGIAAATLPLWARSRYFPPPELALIADWTEKMAVLAPRALEADIRSISGTPSWLLLFIEQLATLRGATDERLVDAFPHLELVVHGGVDFAPYRRRFAALLAGSRAETREVYSASEGFIAIADRGDGEGLRLILDNGLFFEFVPVAELDAPQPTRHWIGTAEAGVNYALALSSCAGLWAYLLGDTVRLIGRRPPRILITGRLSYAVSAFGEHLIGEEIEGAVAEAAAAIEADVTDFVIAPIFPEEPGQRGRHLLLVEFAVPVGEEQLRRFGSAVDAGLAQRNADYREHRAGDFGMAFPEVVGVLPGRFADWMRRRGRFGGQNKVPRVVLDRDLLAELRRHVEAAAPLG